MAEEVEYRLDLRDKPDQYPVGQGKRVVRCPACGLGSYLKSSKRRANGTTTQVYSHGVHLILSLTQPKEVDDMPQCVYEVDASANKPKKAAAPAQPRAPGPLPPKR